MNILLSDVCNRRCSFCFAKSVHEHKGQKFMTIEDFRKVVDFSLRSNERQLRILGGEPTLHPQFIEILDIILEQRASLYVMTNGVIAKHKVDALVEFAKKAPIRFLCNVSEAEKDTDEMKAKREYFFEKFHFLTTPSVTLNSYKVDFSDVVSMIQKYKLQNKIRAGVAHPIVGCDNAYLEPKYFKALNIHLNIARTQLAQQDIILNLDCGVTKCGAVAGHAFCKPIIDVGVDLSVWSCFPLVNFHKVQLLDFPNLKSLEHYFREVLQPYMNKSLFDECQSCEQKSMCCGGCLAHRINL